MRNCSYCQQAFTGHDWNHTCATADLPRARRRDGKYALRRHPDDGHVLWVDVADTKANREFGVAGTSYVVGHVMDPENFEYAVDEAEEESRVLMAQAREEFGA